MPEETTYKRYRLRATPEQLREPAGWSVAVMISRDEGMKAVESLYHAGEELATREQAVKRSFELGRQIIDGHIPGVDPP